MNGVSVTVFLALSVAFSILISSPFYHWAASQIQNTTSPENTNNTRQIINLKDHTIIVINKTTNETLGIMPYTGNKGNMTSGNTGNMTSGNTGNMTTNETHTEKFKALGK